MKRTLALALAVALLASLVGVALANSPSDTATYLLQEAQVSASQNTPDCGPPALLNPPSRATVRSDANPQPGLYDAFGVFRRRATKAELAIGRGVPSDANTLYYVDSIRIAQAPDGYRYVIEPELTPLHPAIQSAACIKRVKAILAPELKRQPAAVRKDVAADERAQAKAQQQLIYASRHDTVELYDYPADDADSASNLYPAAVANGILFISKTVHGGYSTGGLFADGIARITFSFPKLTRTNGHVKTFTTTVPVRDNVTNFTLPAAAGSLYLVKETWYAPSGHVVRHFLTLVIGTALPAAIATRR